MTKTHTQFVCQECGRTSARQFGRCPSCGGWDTMVEEMVERQPDQKTDFDFRSRSKPQKLKDIKNDAQERWTLDMTEFARVLGGGIVPGSIVLIGGDPGIGKSTLMHVCLRAFTFRSSYLFCLG